MDESGKNLDKNKVEKLPNVIYDLFEVTPHHWVGCGARGGEKNRKFFFPINVTSYGNFTEDELAGIYYYLS